MISGVRCRRKIVSVRRRTENIQREQYNQYWNQNVPMAHCNIRVIHQLIPGVWDELTLVYTDGEYSAGLSMRLTANAAIQSIATYDRTRRLLITW